MLESGFCIRFRRNRAPERRFLVGGHAGAAAAAGVCVQWPRHHARLPPQTPAFGVVREIAGPGLRPPLALRRLNLAKRASNTAKPESEPEMPSTQPLAWLMMRAALNIIFYITVLMRRHSAAFLSGLSLSCSVCCPRMRSRFIASCVFR
ncbi:MAG: hypothetical protein DDT26_01406 [Dehalococcoidia bacterium]|nr:hypothetical protein [Chloroflexota bacterium]